MESNKATVAGILDITAGIIGCVGAIPLAFLAFGGAAVLGMVPEPEANRLAMLPLALFLTASVLVALTTAARDAGGDVVILAPSGPVVRLLQISGLEEHLTVDRP